MKTTLLTTILSAAALSAALFAAPTSAKACGCQRQVQAPSQVIVTAPPIVDQSYDGDFYSYDNSTTVVVGVPYGYWVGGYYGHRFFARGYYDNRGVWSQRVWNGGGQRVWSGGQQRVWNGGGQRVWSGGQQLYGDGGHQSGGIVHRR